MTAPTVNFLVNQLQDRNLTKVNLNHLNLTDADAINLAKKIQNNNHVTDFFLAGNKIGDEGAKALAHAFAYKPLSTNVGSIKGFITLDISNNQIGDEGIIALSDALKKRKDVIGLAIGKNNFGIEGARAICDLVSSSSSLQQLYLSADFFESDELVAMLGKALKSNSSLTEIFFDDRPLPKEYHNNERGSWIVIVDELKNNKLIDSIAMKYAKANLVERTVSPVIVLLSKDEVDFLTQPGHPENQMLCVARMLHWDEGMRLGVKERVDNDSTKGFIAAGKHSLEILKNELQIRNDDEEEMVHLSLNKNPDFIKREIDFFQSAIEAMDNPLPTPSAYGVGGLTDQQIKKR